MNPESALTIKIKDHIKDTYRGAYIIKISDRFTNGIPDMYVAFEGKSVWLEIKTPTGKINPLQEHTIHQLNIRGIPAKRVHSVDEAKNFLQKNLTIVK